MCTISPNCGLMKPQPDAETRMRGTYPSVQQDVGHYMILWSPLRREGVSNGHPNNGSAIKTKFYSINIVRQFQPPKEMSQKTNILDVEICRLNSLGLHC